MDGALDQAVRGRPALVVVETDAGMGKSTLIDAFLARCDDGETAQRSLAPSPSRTSRSGWPA